MSETRGYLHRLAALRHDTSGLALLEFAFTLPILLGMGLTGAELTNYITTRMRVSQMALQLADNAARIGTGSQLQAKTISEADINDLLTGAQLQSGELDLKTNGRVILSDIEPTETGATTYKIGWQRCFGDKLYTPKYPPAGVSKTNMPGGIGPAGRLTIAPDNGASMFVEVYYKYRPLVISSLAPSPEMPEIASMMVRDRRDLSDDTYITVNGVTQLNPNPQHPNGVYKVQGVTPSLCG